MADPFTHMTDSLFRQLGLEATYTPPGGGEPVAVKVMVQQPDTGVDVFGATVIAETTMIDVRVSELASPVDGGVFDIGGVSYRIDGEPKRDACRLIWTCPAPEVAA